MCSWFCSLCFLAFIMVGTPNAARCIIPMFLLTINIYCRFKLQLHTRTTIHIDLMLPNVNILIVLIQSRWKFGTFGQRIFCTIIYIVHSTIQAIWTAKIIVDSLKPTCEEEAQFGSNISCGNCIFLRNMWSFRWNSRRSNRSSGGGGGIAYARTSAIASWKHKSRFGVLSRRFSFG